MKSISEAPFELRRWASYESKCWDAVTERSGKGVPLWPVGKNYSLVFILIMSVHAQWFWRQEWERLTFWYKTIPYPIILMCSQCSSISPCLQASISRNEEWTSPPFYHTFYPSFLYLLSTPSLATLCLMTGRLCNRITLGACSKCRSQVSVRSLTRNFWVGVSGIHNFTKFPHDSYIHWSMRTAVSRVLNTEKLQIFPCNHMA